jgi:hypothetical protein
VRDRDELTAFLERMPDEMVRDMARILAARLSEDRPSTAARLDERNASSRAGRPLKGFLTLTPLRSVPDESRRALFQDQRSRLRQRLARAPFKLPFIGLFVREKKARDIHEAGDHCSALLWLPEEIKADDTDTLLRCLSPEINARLDWNNGEAGIRARLDYLQKERAGQAEGYLKKHRKLRYTWESPAPLMGPRWTMTNGLAELVVADAEQIERGKVYQLGWIPIRIGDRTISVDALLASFNDRKARVPEASERIYLFDAEGQGRLFDALSDMLAPEKPSASARRRDKMSAAPMLRLFTVIENIDIIEVMRSLGPTHEAIAERLGISRPQATNIINGQFRPSRTVVRRILELARAA